MTASSDSIHEGCILTGSLFNEPMRVETARTSNDETWTVGLVGTHTERFRKVTLTNQDIKGLTILDSGFTFDGDGHLLFSRKHGKSVWQRCNALSNMSSCP